MLNFSKKKNLFNKLNSSDHSLNSANLPTDNKKNTTTANSANTSSANSNLNSSITSFGTVKIKDKKFFNILSSRPKFLDTPKPKQQQIMPPPQASSLPVTTLASSRTHFIKSTNCLLLRSSEEFASADSVDVNSNPVASNGGSLAESIDNLEQTSSQMASQVMLSLDLNGNNIKDKNSTNKLGSNSSSSLHMIATNNVRNNNG